MERENGNISIQTENIFPIIKKWLYSEKDIFVRELVSNGADAISKLRKLSAIGEAKVDEGERFYIRVVLNRDDRTLKIIDNGIGMTGDEVRKYINQIAFSGVKDFIEKYRDKTDDAQIIGHFGLGFYSAFMVSDKVRIDTMSWQDGAQAVRWTSSNGTEYSMEDSDRTERGTTVTLTISEDSVEFLDEFKMRDVLTKYFSFLPYEVYLLDLSKKPEAENAEKPEGTELDEEDREAADKDTGKAGGKDDEKDAAGASDGDKGKSKGKSRKKDKEKKKDAAAAEEKKQAGPINDTNPLWIKNPKDCTDDEYKQFYQKVFHDFNDPLFWIHLNVDYPFNMKGILYFPKLRHEFETMEGQIKLYYNQVFVADNIKEVIPEFLLLLKGVIDCPDLPLNVSRSFLQNDGYVNKMSAHITKKVADRLVTMYETEKDNYTKYWDDIHPFVKYGCIREQKFFDRVKDSVIYKTTGGEYVTLKEYLERNKDKHENKVFYVSDEKQQAQYIRLFKEHDLEAVILSSLIDAHFMQFLEMKESGVKFSRVDADISENMKEGSESGNEAAAKSESESIEKLFKDALGDDKLKIRVENLKASSVPAIILLSEHSRRMQEMSRMFGGGMDMGTMFPDEHTLVVNRSNNLVKALARLNAEGGRGEDVKLLCKHVFDLAMMSNKQLEPEAMTAFIERSNRILEMVAG